MDAVRKEIDANAEWAHAKPSARFPGKLEAFCVVNNKSAAQTLASKGRSFHRDMASCLCDPDSFKFRSEEVHMCELGNDGTLPVDHRDIFARGRLSAGIPYPAPLVVRGDTKEDLEIPARIAGNMAQERTKGEMEEEEQKKKEKEEQREKKAQETREREELKARGIIIVDGSTYPKES